MYRDDAAYLYLSMMKAPTSDYKLKKCKIMLKAPTSDLIIVKGAYLYLSGMKAPTSDLIIVQGAYLNLSAMKAPTSDDE